MKYQLSLINSPKSILGEGPCWDQDNKLLYWVDILGKKLHQFDFDSNTHQEFPFSQYISAVVLDDTNSLIVAMQNGIYQFNTTTRELFKIVDPEKEKEHNRLNDGKCDPFGRFWIGSMELDGASKQGSLYRLESDGKIDKVLSDVTISNGLAWSPDNRYMYFIDTPTNEVAVYNYDGRTGNISKREVAVTIPKEFGSPDGMTIDSEGMIWVAHWGGGKITRWNPLKEELLEEILIPAKNVTSCVFGGENFNDLFVTTARTGLSDEELQLYPDSGGVFKIETDIQGTPSYKFKNGKE